MSGAAPRRPVRRLPGRWVLAGLALLVALVASGVVAWSRQAPPVPSARDRMRGMAVPAVRPWL